MQNLLKSVVFLAVYFLSLPALAAEAYHPIALPLGQTPNLIGKPLAHIGLYAFQKNEMKPIPFQIDQVNADGKFLLPMDGSLPVKKNKLPQYTTRRDLLLWMPDDMGPSVNVSKLSTDEKQTQWFEIEMTTQTPPSENRFVYAKVSPVQEHSTKDYVTYNREMDLIRTPSFFIGYRDVIVVNRFGWVKQNGSLGENLLHRVAVRFSAKALFGLFPLEITENDIFSEITGYKDGPVRVLKRVKSAPKLPFGMKGPASETDCFFYRNTYQTQVAVDFPVGGKAVLSEAKFRIYIDLPHYSHNLNLVMPHTDRFTIRQDLIPQDFLVSKVPMTWVHFYGDEIPNHFVTYLQVPPNEANVFSPKDLFYLHLGEKTTMGTLYVDIDLKSRSGNHTFSLHLFAPTPLHVDSKTESVLKSIQNDIAAQHALKEFKPVIW